MSAKRAHRLVVLGKSRVGKTAIIEQLVFGNHVVRQVSLCPLQEGCYSTECVNSNEVL